MAQMDFSGREVHGKTRPFEDMCGFVLPDRVAPSGFSLLENNGQFLVIKVLDENFQVTRPQQRILSRLTAIDGFTGLVIWGRPHKRSAYQRWEGGVAGEVTPCWTQDDVLEIVRAWWDSTEA